jgi:hypothetical protein
MKCRMVGLFMNAEWKVVGKRSWPTLRYTDIRGTEEIQGKLETVYHVFGHRFDRGTSTVSSGSAKAAPHFWSGGSETLCC